MSNDIIINLLCDELVFGLIVADCTLREETVEIILWVESFCLASYVVAMAVLGVSVQYNILLLIFRIFSRRPSFLLKTK